MIDLRCCDVADILDDAKGATLVHADPPWGDYVNNPGGAAPEGIYPVLDMATIALTLGDFYVHACRGARLACWTTWPLLQDWMRHGIGGWAFKTAGAWSKADSQGVGYHWLGRSEPLLVYVKDGKPYTDRGADLGNAYTSKPTGHSEKPIEWQRLMLRRWTRPGDLVVDLYAGLAPLARACKLEGRRYLGAEIDPERHRHAMAKLEGTAYCADVRQVGLFDQPTNDEEG